MALISAAEARVYLPGLSGTGADTQLATLITRADQAMAAWCGFEAATAGGAPTLEDVTFTEFYPGPGGRLLQLRHWPIVSITSIEDDPTEAFDGSTYLVASTDYDGPLTVQRKNRGQVWLETTATHGAWSNTKESGTEPVKAVYVAGWATVPEVLKQAAVLQVVHWWHQRAFVGRESVTVQGAGTVQPGPDGGLLPEVKQLLRPFRVLGALG